MTREDLARAAQGAYVQALSDDPWGRWLAVADAVQDAAETKAANATQELLEVLSDVLEQACGTSDGDLESMALSAYAAGIRTLAAFNRVRIKREVGRVVIAEWVR